MTNSHELFDIDMFLTFLLPKARLVHIFLTLNSSPGPTGRIIKQWRLCVCEVIVHKATQTKRVTTKRNKAAKTGGEKATGYTIVAMEWYKYGNNPASVKVCFLLSNGEVQLQTLKSTTNPECWLDEARESGKAGDSTEWDLSSKEEFLPAD